MLALTVDGWEWWVVAIGGLAVLGLSIADNLRVRSLRSRDRALIHDAEIRAEQIVSDARQAADEESDRIRQDAEQKVRRKTLELDEREQRFRVQQDLLHSQMENQVRRETQLAADQAILGEERHRLEALIDGARSQGEELRKRLIEVASLSEEQAKKKLMDTVASEAHEQARDLTNRILEQAKREAHEQAGRIIGIAMQRYVGDSVSATTISAVALESDEIKGRIIGREGRNIRAFENATGMTVLIDDTPNTVIVSGFDPVRREIARESMERLVADGRIHPTRIEEVVEKVSADIGERIVKMGEKVVSQLRLAPMHPAILERLGRLYFRRSYSQNVLDHSVEVARLTQLIAVELGFDPTDALRAGLLHDIGKALGDEIDGSHAVAGGKFVRSHGENSVVAEAVASHHDENEHKTVLGILVGAADAISASRPGARSETVESYLRRLNDLEEVGKSFDGVERCFAFHAGREVRAFVLPEKVSDEEAKLLARKLCRKIEEQLQYPGQIRVTVVREVRCIEYAK